MEPKTGENALKKVFYLGPGYVFVPAEPTKISLVVTSGVAVTIYDRERKRGGVGHYARPYRNKGASTAMFAAPSITTLVKVFLNSGASATGLEAQVYGGAENPEAEKYEAGLGRENVEAGLKVLEKLKVTVATVDAGGARGRKIVFDSGTGEIIVAKVDKVRLDDWYPDCD